MKLLSLSAIASLCILTLAGCQSTAQVYNGVSGYQVQSKDAQSAVLSYTMSARQGQVNQAKLQQACQQVLGSQKQYKIEILAQQEIINPKQIQQPAYGVSMKKDTRMSFSLSNTPDLYHSEGYATRQSLEAQPSTLLLVNYRCL